MQLKEWHTEADLKVDYDRVKIRDRNGKLRDVSLIPDSYCLIVSQDRTYPLFIEYDGGTQRSQVIKEKVRAYDEYYRSRKYYARYNRKAFRVLFVSKSAKRITDLKIWTEDLKTPIQEAFWFAKLDSLTPTTTLNQMIWQYAGSDTLQSLI